MAGHSTDLWGVVLVTLGVLAALAFYADSLNVAGHDARLFVGDLLGWGRFLVPAAAVAVGLRLLIGRGDEEEHTSREPARAVVGASLALLAVAGLAGLAGEAERGRRPCRAAASASSALLRTSEASTAGSSCIT